MDPRVLWTSDRSSRTYQIYKPEDKHLMWDTWTISYSLTINVRLNSNPLLQLLIKITLRTSRLKRELKQLPSQCHLKGFYFRRDNSRYPIFQLSTLMSDQALASYVKEEISNRTSSLIRRKDHLYLSGEMDFKHWSLKEQRHISTQRESNSKC